MAKDAAAQALEELEIKEEWISAIPKKPEPKEEEPEEKEEQTFDSLVDMLRSQVDTLEDEVQDAPKHQTESNEFSYNSDTKSGYDSSIDDSYGKASSNHNAYTQSTATQMALDHKPKNKTGNKTFAEESGYHGRLL
ncbi:MAG: hypothetical protein ACE5FT_06160 [Candidatus Nanoarchaeia archaeon]